MTVTHQSYTKAMERRKAQWLLKYAKDIKGQSLPRFPWGFPFQNRSRPPTLGSCGILRDPAGSCGPGPLGGVEDHDLVLCRSGWSDHLSRSLCEASRAAQEVIWIRVDLPL